jgi:hypothetical protein
MKLQSLVERVLPEEYSQKVRGVFGGYLEGDDDLAVELEEHEEAEESDDEECDTQDVIRRTRNP